MFNYVSRLSYVVRSSAVPGSPQPPNGSSRVLGRRGWLVRRGAADEEIEELSDLDVVFEGVSKVGVGFEVIQVAAPFLFVGEVPRRLELGDVPLGSALGDADAVGYVTQSDAGSLGDQDEHPGAVGEKGPCSRFFVGQSCILTVVAC